MSSIHQKTRYITREVLGPDATLHHSWNSMPTPWTDQGPESLERRFHDALMGGAAATVNRINRAMWDLHYEVSSDPVTRWLALIVRVPLALIGQISLTTLRRLIPLHAAILAKRGRKEAYDALQIVWMPDFEAFQAARPWRASSATSWRYNRAGVYTVELRPGVLTWEEVLRLYAVWSRGYTSAKYQLLVAPQHAVSTLGLTWHGAYNQGAIYPEGAAVTLNGKVYRALVTPRAGVAPGEGGPIWTVADAPDGFFNRGQYAAGVRYYANDAVQSLGRWYILRASSALNVQPLPDLPVWSEVTAPRDPSLEGRFITAMPHANTWQITNDGGVASVTGGVTNCLGASLGTPWRYPPQPDLAAWFYTKPLPPRHVVVGLLATDFRVNLPTYARAGDMLVPTSPHAALNQPRLRWGNLLEE